MDERTILLNVLSIIGYEDDRKIFADKFFSNIYLEAIAQQASSLDKDTKEKLEKELGSTTDEEIQKSVFLKYFPKEEFNKKLTQITQDQFGDYLKAIYPTLNFQKQEELSSFLSNLPKP